MKTTTAVIVLIVVLLLGGAAYYWYSGQNSAYSPPSQSNSGAYNTGTTQPQGDGTGVSQNLILGLSTSATLGQYLSAYNGMTVYTYAPDAATPGKSACTGTCAANWPPYTVASASDINVSSATTGTVGTIVRADGTLQVTYNGKPLYFYIKDTAPGQTTGQGVGGVWYVVTP